MVPAGRILVLKKIRSSKGVCCDATSGTREYAPIWVTPAYLDRIRVSIAMLRDHLPDVVDSVLIQVARTVLRDNVRDSGWWYPHPAADDA